MTTAKPQSAVT